MAYPSQFSDIYGRVIANVRLDAEADLQREEFVAYLKAWSQIVSAKLAAELEWPWPRVPEYAA